MAKIRDYGKLAADIKNTIGESNITSATHVRRVCVCFSKRTRVTK